MTDDRIQQLLDRVEITDLKHAYTRAADDRDANAMVERFVPDCTAEYSLGQAIEDGAALRIEGRDALRDWLGQHLGNVVSSSHHLTNVEVTFVDSDTATMRANLYSWQRLQHQDGLDRHCFGRCLDTWVRTPDGWRQSTLGFRLAGEITSAVPSPIGEHH
jgi:ketosteroid isomerase-like protein